MAVRIGSIEVGGAELTFVAGPDVIESEDHCLAIAGALAELAAREKLPLIFKCSYDKANRTSVAGYRGPGLERGLPILAKVRERTGLPLLTDIHEPAQAAAAAQVVDVLQVPAFLSRQTDLIQAAARTGKPVNLKKGQFLAPAEAAHAVEKARATGNQQVLLTERGTCFGYHNWVVDFRGFPILRATGCPLLFDASHSSQLPGAAGSASGGDAGMIPVLARAAVAAGCDGIYLEVHDHPEQALCDGPSALPLDRLRELTCRLRDLHAFLR
jgi:2-dehydro-3-deoxyphosphooctonate aldolase (KDO 8-P synthase)